MRTHANFTRVNEIEAMYERPSVDVKVERGSTSTYKRDLPYGVSSLFTRAKFTCVRIEILRDSENPPLSFYVLFFQMLVM